MPKLRKQRRRKVYKHNVNRKRLRNKLNSQGNIACDEVSLSKEIKNAWDAKKSTQFNMKEMGLCYDPNATIKITKKKKSTKSSEDATKKIGEWDVEDIRDTSNVAVPKKHVLDALIEDAITPRAKMFRLPKGQIEYLTYMLNKYGLDFKAMVKDKKNYNQDTWKQLRSKIRRFQSIPEQYSDYLKNASKEVLSKLEQELQMDEDD